MHEGGVGVAKGAQEAEASKCQVSTRHAFFHLNGNGMTFQVQRTLATNIPAELWRLQG